LFWSKGAVQPPWIFAKPIQNLSSRTTAVQTIKSGDNAARLNAQELCADYARKLHASLPLAFVSHFASASGSTLVLHVAASNVEANRALANLSAQLRELCAGLPEGSVAIEDVEIDETAKAVSDKPRRGRKKQPAPAPAEVVDGQGTVDSSTASQPDGN
jgi:hypothetical protein